MIVRDIPYICSTNLGYIPVSGILFTNNLSRSDLGEVFSFFLLSSHSLLN